LLAVFAALGLWLAWVSLPWPLIHDAPILHYVAWRIGEGAMPYRNLFDMNQPGAYLVHLAILRTLGEGDFAWRVFDLAVLAAAALAIRTFAAPWGPVAGWGGALVFVVYHLGGGAWQAGQRDFFITPLLVVGAHLTARVLEGPAAGDLSRAALAGLALGAAVTVKPYALLLGLTLAAVLFLGAPRRRLAAAGACLLGLAAVPATVLGWLAARGAVGAWWEIVTGYLVPLYAHLGRAEDWTLYRRGHWPALGAAVAVGLASAAAGRRLGARHAVALLGLGYGLVHFFGQRKGWEYHLYPLAAFASVLAFVELEARVRARSSAFALPGTVALAALAFLLAVRGYEAGTAEWVWDRERVVRLLVDDLAPRLRAGDTVQVLDTTGGGIHALARLRRAQPTRFLYEFHFHHDADVPAIQALRAEFEGAMAAQPPAFVVVFARIWPGGGYERLDRLPGVKRQLERDYETVEARPWYTILAKRDRS
jgi:hypothetical protein